ncbi:hypothetical protein BT69DRAFT_1294645 [Atractiella rhizophila]|nr:hypothetical protein BT69DRAFT_1294645 [Atractiella rhizophila]
MSTDTQLFDFVLANKDRKESTVYWDVEKAKEVNFGCEWFMSLRKGLVMGSFVVPAADALWDELRVWVEQAVLVEEEAAKFGFSLLNQQRKERELFLFDTKKRLAKEEEERQRAALETLGDRNPFAGVPVAEFVVRDGTVRISDKELDAAKYRYFWPGTQEAYSHAAANINLGELELELVITTPRANLLPTLASIGTQQCSNYTGKIRAAPVKAAKKKAKADNDSQLKQHWTNFVPAVKIITNIQAASLPQLQSAASFMRSFCTGFEELYMPNIPALVCCVPMSLHQLLHIVPSSRILGSPMNFTQLPLERNLGTEKDKLGSRRLPYGEIANNLIRRKQLNILKLYIPHIDTSPKPTERTNTFSSKSRSRTFDSALESSILTTPQSYLMSVMGTEYESEDIAKIHSQSEKSAKMHLADGTVVCSLENESRQRNAIRRAHRFVNKQYNLSWALIQAPTPKRNCKTADIGLSNIQEPQLRLWRKRLKECEGLCWIPHVTSANKTMILRPASSLPLTLKDVEEVQNLVAQRKKQRKLKSDAVAEQERREMEERKKQLEQQDTAQIGEDYIGCNCKLSDWGSPL